MLVFPILRSKEHILWRFLTILRRWASARLQLLEALFKKPSRLQNLNIWMYSFLLFCFSSDYKKGFLFCSEVHLWLFKCKLTQTTKKLSFVKQTITFSVKKKSSIFFICFIWTVRNGQLKLFHGTWANIKRVTAFLRESGCFT